MPKPDPGRWRVYASAPDPATFGSRRVAAIRAGTLRKLGCEVTVYERAGGDWQLARPAAGFLDRLRGRRG